MANCLSRTTKDVSSDLSRFKWLKGKRLPLYCELVTNDLLEMTPLKTFFRRGSSSEFPSGPSLTFVINVLILKERKRKNNKVILSFLILNDLSTNFNANFNLYEKSF